MQTVRELTKGLHQVEQAIESAPQIILKPDGTWSPAKGGRVASGAVKVPVLGSLPKMTMPVTARIGTRRGRALGATVGAGRTTTGVRRTAGRRSTTAARSRSVRARST